MQSDRLLSLMTDSLSLYQPSPVDSPSPYREDNLGERRTPGSTRSLERGADVGMTLRDWWPYLLIGIVAFSLRWTNLGNVAVEHFDEGVYASNIFCGPESNFHYPAQYLYAPPLLPWLIEWGHVLFGPGALAAFWPNLVAGTLTPLLVCRLGTRWFNPRLGLLAGLMLATSDAHIAFSRSAMTDALLVFWWLLVVDQLELAIKNNSPRGAMLAGLLTGLAWWTKYNGWLPLALAVPPVAWRHLQVWRSKAEPDAPRALPPLTLWGITCGVAVAVWSPWLWNLQGEGGYASVMANHRQYVVGFAGWESGLSSQSFLFMMNAGAWTYAGMGVALWLGVLTPAACFTWNTSPDAKRWGGMDALWLVSWLAGMALLVPLYRPYFRLMLPLLPAMCLAAGWLNFELRDGFPVPSVSGNGPPRTSQGEWWGQILGVLLGALSIGLGICLGLQEPNGTTRMEPRTNIRDTARYLVEGPLRQQPEPIVYVYGEPALYYHLKAAGLSLVAPVSHLRFADPETPRPEVPIYLVVGPHALADQRFEQQFQATRKQWERIDDKLLCPSWFVAQDDFLEALKGKGNLTPVVVLYRLK